MFGHKKRKNIKRIRKDVSKIRKMEEYEYSNKNTKNLNPFYLSIAIIIVFFIFSQNDKGSPRNEKEIINSSSNTISTTSNKLIDQSSEKENIEIYYINQENAKIQENEKNISLNELNKSKLDGTNLSTIQKNNLLNVLNNKNWTLISIKKSYDWAKGNRYTISVNKGFDYKVYFDGDKIQSINNMKNEIVYGSRAQY